MKNILITLIFSIIAFVSFGQNTDENGRTESQRLAVKAPTPPEVFLTEMKEVKTSTSFKLNYSLPEGKSNGEIKFFNPSKDEELKSIKISERKGVISVSTTDFSVKGVVVGLYADGILVETSRVSFTQ